MSAKATGGPAKPRKPDDGVLGSLPSTRPNKLGRRAREETKPKAAPKPKPVTVAAAKPEPSPAPAPRPKAIRAGAPKLKATVEPPKSTQQTGTELVTTVVQAAGELVQIGLTVGGQILKRALRRD